MSEPDYGLVRKWIEKNKPRREVVDSVYRWDSARDLPEDALRLLWDYESWLTDRSKPRPDMVRCAALYGTTRRIIKEYKEPPIPVAPNDVARWHEADYFVTLQDFYDRLATVAGGWLEFGTRDPKLFVDILTEQLEQKFTELEQLVDKPLDPYYTPEDPPDEGGDDLFERRQFNRPFDLYEEIDSFEWALERLRMMVMTETSPKLRLPNPALHEEFYRFDMSEILRRLHDVEPKLKRILRYLEDHNSNAIDDFMMPDAFWWRHWKDRSKKHKK